jgi:thioredoxin reductase
MAATNRFIIKRKDQDSTLDDLIIESEGLSIGRLISNDLVLNNRAVSRTHAGLKIVGGEYWLFNFSQSNGTYLNGELVDKTPIADNDVIQIGPFVLLVRYALSALSITVERQLQAQTVEGGELARPLPPGESEADMATVVWKPPVVQQRAVTITPGGTQRFQGTGMLTGTLKQLDEQALDIFWKNRKREAGKIAAKTPLHPVGNQRVGKAQFNWRPTLDLRRVWRKSYFWLGAIAVGLASIAAYLIYESAYSPGEVSSAHAAMIPSESLPARNIAARPNSNSCSNCHGVTEGMQDKCISCHTTSTTQKKAAFQPTIYDAHLREDIACSSCHTEHQGQDIHAGLVSYNLCANCHNGSYKIKTGQNAGSLLAIPHGGTIGYPVTDGKWDWKLSADYIKRKGLPEKWKDDEPKDQFHNIHLKGRMLNRMNCGDCHSRGAVGGRDWQVSPRDECSKCHGFNEGAGTVGAVQANCNTCHQQHGQAEDLARVLDVAGTENKKIKDYMASLTGGGPDQNNRRATAQVFSGTGVGAAEVLRQNKDVLNTGLLANVGALPWYAWAGLLGLVPIAGLAVMAVGTARRRSYLKAASAQVKAAETDVPITGSLDFEKLKAEGPAYPHPVIDPLLCIGCHACVEACPHDVLAIVNGISTPIALDQCMEDTGCTIECPTSPKACIVLNTNKKIPARKVPARDSRLKTNVDGVYMIGDVSGVPLIKNAINEGGQVIDFIAEDLRSAPANPNAQYDVAIIGIGPAGLSAAVLAKQRGLSYVAIEQDTLVATIANYPAGKYVFFKPDTVEAKGGIPLPGVGDKKETMIKAWMDTMMGNGVEVHEEERCTAVKRDAGCFTIATEKGKTKEEAEYRARSVILAIGNRGAPMTLKVAGEDLKIRVEPQPQIAKHCPACGTSSAKMQRFCVKCGGQLPMKTVPPFDDPKVKYKLSDPDDYVGKKCIIVGAGNSAIEAAVDLTGFKRDGDSFSFTRDNEVTLVVRSDFKGDLKLGNKMNVYDCIDAGKIKVYFRTEIKEIKEGEVTLMDVRSKEEKARIPNDYVFALIGGEKPTKFLESIGVQIGAGSGGDAKAGAAKGH